MSEWRESDEAIFRAIIKIAHHTGFSKEELTKWTIDEVEMSLKIIREEEQRKNLETLGFINYYTLLTSKYQKNEGTKEKPKIVFDEAAYNQSRKDIDAIKEFLTGVKSEAQETGESKNISIFNRFGGNYKVTEEMSIEEFKKFKENDKPN